MSYTKSIRDTLAELSAEVKRNLSDITIDHLGTETQVLRISLGEENILGDRDETLKTYIISNVIIKHPMGNNQWLFSTLDADNTLQTDAINIWDILPITMKIKYSADYDTEPVSIQNGDLIVELLRDENQNNIPVIMQVTKLVGGFEGKYLYQKHYELALYRGIIPSDIQNAIDKFIADEVVITRTTTGNSTVVTRTEIVEVTDNIIDIYKAGQNLIKNRVVIVDTDSLVYYADSSILNHANRVLGVVLTSVNKNGNVRIQTFDKLQNTSWNWDITLPLFLGTDGSLTQIAPITGFSLEIGKPIITDTIFINIQQPIIL